MTTQQQQPNKDQKQNPQPTGNKAVIEKNISDQVLGRVKQLEENNGLHLPENYSAANALKSAWLILLETTDKDKRPALEVCTLESISNSLFDMVVQGLNPVKKQCYFIVYGNKLQLQRSYMGTIAVAKRFANVKEVWAHVVYQDDVFKYEIDPVTHRVKIIEHKQKLENIDNNKIKGAYAGVIFNDGSSTVEIMTLPQIQQAWKQGKIFGGEKAGTHEKFTDQMCGKTVIGRACKLLINSSDDGELLIEKADPNVADAATQKLAAAENIDYEEMPATAPVNTPPVKPEILKQEPTTEPNKAQATSGTGDANAKTEKKQPTVITPEIKY